MLRHTNFDASQISSGGLLVSGTAGDVLDTIRTYLLSVADQSRWQEVTDDDPTPEAIRQYASNYTPGTNDGSWGARDQQITFYLKDDVGLPGHWKIMSISKNNTTGSFPRIIVSVRDSLSTGWAGYMTSANQTRWYLHNGGTSRLFITETNNVLSFVTTNNSRTNFDSYNLLCYPEPPADGHYARDTPGMPHLTISNADNQNSSNTTNTVLYSNIEAAYGGPGGFIRAATGAPFEGSDIHGRMMLPPAMIARYRDGPVFYTEHLDEVRAAFNGQFSDPLTTIMIEGRRYMRVVHYANTSQALALHILVDHEAP